MDKPRHGEDGRMLVHNAERESRYIYQQKRSSTSVAGRDKTYYGSRAEQEKADSTITNDAMARTGRYGNERYPRDISHDCP